MMVASKIWNELRRKNRRTSTLRREGLLRLLRSAQAEEINGGTPTVNNVKSTTLKYSRNGSHAPRLTIDILKSKNDISNIYFKNINA